MADKEKLSVSIEAIDNFSSVFKELEKRLAQLEKKQSKIDKSSLNSFDRRLRYLEKDVDNSLTSNKLKYLSNMGGKSHEAESSIARIVKEAKSLTEDMDKSLKNLASKKINDEALFTSVRRTFFSDNAKDIINGLKQYKTASIEPKIDKKSIEKVQKEVQKELDKKPVKQKVEVETKKESTKKVNKEPIAEEAKPPKKESVIKKIQKEPVDKPSKKETVEITPKIDKKAVQKEEIKIKAVVDENSLKSSLNAAISKLNQNSPIIKVLVKLNSSGLLKELKDISTNTNIQKIEVPVAAKFRDFATDLKAQLKTVEAKIQVGASVDTKSLNKNIQDSLKDVKAQNVKVPLKVTATGLTKAINDVLKEAKISGVEIPVKINQDKFKKSIDSAKNKLKDFISTVYKIIIILNEEKLQKSINSVQNRLTKLTNKDRKIRIDTDSRRIITKIRNISNKIAELSSKKLDINTGDLELKLIRLSTYINNINNRRINIKVDVDKSIQNVNKLFTTLIKLSAMNISIKDGLALNNINNVKKALQDLKKEKPKLQFDTSEITTKNSQLKTTANTLKNITEAIKALKSRKMNISFNTKTIGPAIKLIRSLNKELSNIKNYILISIKVKENDSVQKLKEIINLVRELKKNRNIIINTRGGTNRRGNYSNNRRNNYSNNQDSDIFTWQYVGQFFSGATQFFGRSNKGFGSFLEAVSKVTDNMLKTGGVVGVFGVALSAVSAALSTTVTVVGLWINQVRFFGETLKTIGQYIYTALKPGIELYKQRQSSLFSFTAAIQSSGVLADGRTLQDMGDEGRTIARGLAKQLIDKATLDAELSAFNLEDILTSLQGTLPILMKLGMSIKQAYEINKGVAAVAKMIRLSPGQILQETRDIAQGSITSRASQVGNALGINNEELKKYKGNADELFAYLMKKFSNYSELLNEYEDTAVGRFEQLTDRWKTATNSIVEQIAPQFKGLFEMLISMTGKWVTENGTMLDVFTQQWVDKNGNILGNFGDKDVTEKYNLTGLHFEPSPVLEETKDALIEIIEYTATIIDGWTLYAQKAFGTVDVVETLKNIIKTILDYMSQLIFTAMMTMKFLKDNEEAIISIIKLIGRIVVFAGKIIVDVVEITDGIKYLYYLMKSLVTETGLWVKVLGKAAIGDFAGAGQIVQDILFNTNNGDLGRVHLDLGADIKLNEKLKEAFEGDWSNIRTLDDFNRLFDMERARGTFTNAVEKYKNKNVDGSDKGDSKGLSLKDVKGHQQIDEKALVKESQKMLREQLQKLKETLKDALGELKDVLEKNKIAYDEGFMSIKDYFTQKADIEAQEAALRLQEANDELTAIMKAQFDNEYDRERELHRVNREIRQYTRELNNAKTAISETNRAWRESVQSLNSFTAFMNNFQNGQPTGNINSKESPMTASNENLFGYTPPEEYSLAGLDTRYADFADMESGVETQINGLNGSVKKLLNIINKMYYEKTGERIVYTSFTGDLTGATENPHSDSEYGHKGGWKADAYAAFKDIYIELHKQFGVATRWERDHFDSSYGPGSTYTGGFGTPYTTGEAWYNRLRQAIGAIPGSMDSFHTTPNTTTLSHELQRALEEFNKKIEDYASQASDTILNIYSTDFLGGAKAKINLIAQKYQKQIKELNINMKDSPELQKAYNAAMGNLLTLMNTEMEDALVSYLDKRLNYNIEASKTWGNYAAFETFSGRGMKPAEFLNKYHKYYYNDVNNPLAPASVIAKMWDSVIQFQKLGAVDKAQELRQKILSKYDELNGIFTNYMNNISNYFSNYKEWLSNTDATELQKKFGEREIEARYNEIKSNVLGIQIQANTGQLEQYQRELDGIIERLEEIDRLQKSADTSAEEKSSLAIEKSKLEAQRDGLNLQRQKLEMTNEELKVQKLLADQIKHHDKYLYQLKETAKQALEHGLVHFLTDGINEAENLGEALRNLAIDFLKTMQRFFAENMVKDLMNMWFPQKKVPVSGDKNKEDEYAAATGYLDKFGRNNTEINPTQFMQQSMGMFEQQVQQTSNGLGLVSQSANDVATSLNNLASSVKQSTSTNVADMGVTEQKTQATLMNTEMEKINTTATNQNTNATANNTVTTKTNTMAQQSSSFATTGGGYGAQAGMAGAGLPGGFSALSVNQGSYSGLFGSIMQPIGGLVNSILTPISKLATGIIDPITKMLNSSAFTQLQSSVMGLVGSSGAQLGGSIYAIKTLFKGDTKEKFLSMIFLELQLIYVTLSQIGVQIAQLVAQLSAFAGLGGYAHGGLITGSGSSTSDDIPAMLSNGEAVLNAQAVRKLGLNFINAVNNGEFTKIRATLPHFATGGVVNEAMQSTAKGMTDFASSIGTSVSTTNQMNIALVRDENSAIEHFMRSPKGQKILVDFNKGNSTIFSRFGSA